MNTPPADQRDATRRRRAPAVHPNSLLAMFAAERSNSTRTP